jgi:hypothetical protein
VERNGFDVAVLDRAGQALATAQTRSQSDVGLASESAEWFKHWKDNNPDFKRELG